MCGFIKAALARLEALESDNAPVERIEINDEDDASLDDEDEGKSTYFGNIKSFLCQNYSFLYIRGNSFFVIALFRNIAERAFSAESFFITPIFRTISNGTNANAQSDDQSLKYTF